VNEATEGVGNDRRRALDKSNDRRSAHGFHRNTRICLSLIFPSSSSSPSPGAICPHGSRACSLSLSPTYQSIRSHGFIHPRRWGSAGSSQQFVFGSGRGRTSKSHRPAQATTIDDRERRGAREKREKAGER